jgi:ATP-dependent Lhr-like helicase
MIGTIEQELALCRAAFAGVEVGALAWCIHHDQLIELLTQPVEDRIRCILEDKPEHERACRLHNLRPVRGEVPAELSKASAELSKASAEWSKASAELSKASAELSKASAELSKAYAEWSKASAELSKASAELSKAYAEWSKAYADNLPALTALHAAECPDSTWDGKSIFGDLGRR